MQTTQIGLAARAVVTKDRHKDTWVSPQMTAYRAASEEMHCPFLSTSNTFCQCFDDVHWVSLLLWLSLIPLLG